MDNSTEKKIRESIKQALKEIGGESLPDNTMEPEERPTTQRGNAEKMMSEDVYLFESRKKELNERLLAKFIPKKGK